MRGFVRANAHLRRLFRRQSPRVTAPTAPPAYVNERRSQKQNAWARLAKQQLRKQLIFHRPMPDAAVRVALQRVADERSMARPDALIRATSFRRRKRCRLKTASPGEWNRRLFPERLSQSASLKAQPSKSSRRNWELNRKTS